MAAFTSLIDIALGDSGAKKSFKIIKILLILGVLKGKEKLMLNDSIICQWYTS